MANSRPICDIGSSCRNNLQNLWRADVARGHAPKETTSEKCEVSDAAVKKGKSSFKSSFNVTYLASHGGRKALWAEELLERFDYLASDMGLFESSPGVDHRLRRNDAVRAMVIQYLEAIAANASIGVERLSWYRCNKTNSYSFRSLSGQSIGSKSKGLPEHFLVHCRQSTCSYER
jgi:hypothetical protein